MEEKDAAEYTILDMRQNLTNGNKNYIVFRYMAMNT